MMLLARQAFATTRKETPFVVRSLAYVPADA